MKKNIFITLLLVALLFTFTACGATTGNDDTDTSAETENGTDTDVVEEAETDWPTKPVNAVLHASAGGDTDFNARTFATYFEEITGQPLIITNMPGSSGVASTEHVRQSEADGYTVGFMHTGPLVVNYVSGLVDYTYEAFDVSTIPAVDGGTVLVASAESGLTSMSDIVEKSQAEPESIVFGTEFGNYSHLQVLDIENKADIKFRMADIGSTSEKVTNLLGGRIDLAAITYGSVKDYIETGEMIAIAQFNAEPNEYLGDVPTMVSEGIDMIMDKPYIIAFPEGTDPAIVQKMSDIAVQISEIEDYGIDLRDGFSQEVKVYETDDAIDYLDETLESFMEYSDILQGAN